MRKLIVYNYPVTKTDSFLLRKIIYQFSFLIENNIPEIKKETKTMYKKFRAKNLRTNFVKTFEISEARGRITLGYQVQSKL